MADESTGALQIPAGLYGGTPCDTMEREPMVLFGHVGVTLGASILLVGAARTILGTGTPRGGMGESFSLSSGHTFFLGRCLDRMRSWLTLLGESFDVRLVLLASIFPDIVDKPLGQVLLRETVSNGRIYCHTLLFLALVTVLGLLVYWRLSWTWLLVIAFGTGTHLVLDSMWRWPQTLFWPAYGWTFEKLDLDHWIDRVWHGLLTDSALYVVEIIGLMVMAWFLWNLLHRGKFWEFVRTGYIG